MGFCSSNFKKIFILYCMKKIHFKVVKLNRVFTNIAIAFILLIVGGFAVFAGVHYTATPASSVVNGAYYSGDKSSNKVSLMINVYWGTEYLDEILDILDEKNVKTTFFIGGTWAVMNESYLKKIDERGHELANHGYHHKDHDKISQEENIKQIKNTHVIVEKLLGKEMNLFAPPSGAYNKTTVNAASSLGYKTIMWTRDTIDWRDKDSELVYDIAVKDACGGDLVLMHPTEHTTKALPKIIDCLQEKGLKVTTVSDTIEGVVN